jgi:hypothetical protein
VGKLCASAGEINDYIPWDEQKSAAGALIFMHSKETEWLLNRVTPFCYPVGKKLPEAGSLVFMA